MKQFGKTTVKFFYKRTKGPRKVVLGQVANESRCEPQVLVICEREGRHPRKSLIFEATHFQPTQIFVTAKTMRACQRITLTKKGLRKDFYEIPSINRLQFSLLGFKITNFSTTPSFPTNERHVLKEGNKFRLPCLINFPTLIETSGTHRQCTNILITYASKLCSIYLMLVFQEVFVYNVL